MFPTNYVPTIFDNYITNVTIGDKKIALELWDTAGQEDYEELRPLSYPETDIFLITYSIVGPDSFDNVKQKWHKELKDYWEKENTAPVPIMLVGTKKDLLTNREILEELKKQEKTIVTTEQAKQLAEEINAVDYLECSAKSLDGLKNVFDRAIVHVLQDRDGRRSSGGCCTVI